MYYNTKIIELLASLVIIKLMVIDELGPLRRELYLQILNGEPAKFAGNISNIHFSIITTKLHFLENHFPPKHLNKALIWLINNGIVGKKFSKWFNETCKTELEMHRLLLSIVENDVLKPIIAGQNFKQ